MKRILIICCIAGLFSACSDFLKEYSQDLAKVESFSDLDEVLLGKGYLPWGRSEAGLRYVDGGGCVFSGHSSHGG